MNFYFFNLFKAPLLRVLIGVSGILITGCFPIYIGILFQSSCFPNRRWFLSCQHCTEGLWFCIPFSLANRKHPRMAMNRSFRFLLYPVLWRLLTWLAFCSCMVPRHFLHLELWFEGTTWWMGKMFHLNCFFHTLGF